MKIVLSSKTLTRLKKLKKIKSQEANLAKVFNLDDSNTVKLAELSAWLKQNEELVLCEEDQLEDEDSQLLLASFNASLLQDLSKSLPGRKGRRTNKRKTSWANQAKYGLLVFAGTLFFACEGFDGITAIVGILSMSTTGLFIIGTIFAFISVMAFYAFNLTEISRNLGIQRKEARQLVDRYLKEVEEINAIRSQLNNNYLRRKTVEELEADLLITELLIARYQALDEGRRTLTKQSKSWKLSFIRYFIGLVIGVIYFSSGFFAGQAVAIAVAGLFVAAGAPIFWPVLVASIIVGFAAFSVYWFVERPSIDKLVGRWFGLDKEKIELLTRVEKIQNDEAKLINLKENLTHRILNRGKTPGEFRLQEAEARIKELRRLLAGRQLGDNFSRPGFFSEPGQRSEELRELALELSPKTLTLIEQLRAQEGYGEKVSAILDAPDGSGTLKLRRLIQWLTPKRMANASLADDEDLQFLLSSLNTSLLKDMAKSLPDTRIEDKQRAKVSKGRGLIYTLLAVAGTIYFGCEGFDGITSIISMFSVPKLAIFAVGAFFAVISIMAFYAFDLTEISRNLGVKKKNVNKLVDVHLKEVAAINAIRRHLDHNYTKRTSLTEIEDDLQITNLLLARYKKLDEGRVSLTRLLASTKLTVLKYFVAAVIGIIYFSGGFFTGQAVALAIAGLFVTSTASLFWPIFIASFAIGLAALGVYWFVERPGIDKLVSRLCGLDQEKIEGLSNPAKIGAHSEKLNQLKMNILSYKASMETVVEEDADSAKKLRQANETINELTLKLGEGLQKRGKARSLGGDANDEFASAEIKRTSSFSDSEFAVSNTI